MQELKLASLVRFADCVNDAPRKTQRQGVWYEIYIGIGSDHMAYITIDDDALKALCDRQGLDHDELISRGPISEKK